MRVRAIAIFVTLVAIIAFSGVPASAQTAPPSAPPAARPFQDQDAARLMSQFRQALENENKSRFLKLFDSSRMPDYPVFRDEVAQFLARYQPPRINYSINQVSQDGPLGAVILELSLEATPWTNGEPDIRRSAQVRLVTSWDGKDWKIADFSPRDFFR